MWVWVWVQALVWVSKCMYSVGRYIVCMWAVILCTYIRTYIPLVIVVCVRILCTYAYTLCACMSQYIVEIHMSV